MSDSRCGVGKIYFASGFDDLLGLFPGYTSERTKAKKCAASIGGHTQKTLLRADIDLHNKIIGAYLTIIAGK